MNDSALLSQGDGTANQDIQAATEDRAAAIKELGDAWRETSAAHRRLRGRDAMQPDQLSVPQYNLLSPLLQHPALPSGELAAAVGVTPATATHMLEQLASGGIVTRTRSDRDRRVVMTGLTAKGSELLQRKHEVLSECWERAIADLDVDAIRQAADVLRRMTKYVDEN